MLSDPRPVDLQSLGSQKDKLEYRLTRIALERLCPLARDTAETFTGLMVLYIWRGRTGPVRLTRRAGTYRGLCRRSFRMAQMSTQRQGKIGMCPNRARSKRFRHMLQFPSAIRLLKLGFSCRTSARPKAFMVAARGSMRSVSSLWRLLSLMSP